MKITVYGSGYVGLVTAACLADVGHKILNIEVDKEIVENLNLGKVHIFEPGLEALIRSNVIGERLQFSTDYKEGVRFSNIQIIATGTPENLDGSANISSILEVASQIASEMESSQIILIKSTVPVGTCDKVSGIVGEILKSRGVEHLSFDVVFNPEFLKEGMAISDFARPDRIVIGSNSEKSIKILREMYSPFQRHHERMIIMDPRSSEMTKYAANAMLATRISFMNELANLAPDLGFDIDQVRRGIGSDSRIGFDFLYAGIGYGGYCLPKDVASLSSQAVDHGKSLRILNAVVEVNNNQTNIMIQNISRQFNDDLSGIKIAVWGLSFKPFTDDVRNAPSIRVINGLLQKNAQIFAYDPVAIPNIKRVLPESQNLKFCKNAMDALGGVDCLCIITEWKEFRSPCFEKMKNVMKTPIIFDGRNLYSPQNMKEMGFEYHSNRCLMNDFNK